MIEVDFYILQQTDPQACIVQACRLLEEAYQAGRKVHIHTDNEAQAVKLDESLWTFNDNSFIPHNMIGEGPNFPPPIQIGYANHKPNSHDILLNLSLEVPDFAGQFKKIIEIVPQDESYKQALRDHYRYYRQQGFAVKSHQV